jgi:hypothetical protein
MMDIDLPPAISEFFKSILDFNLVPNLLQYFVQDTGPTPTAAWKRVGIPSTLFILNAGQSSTTFLLY